MKRVNKKGFTLIELLAVIVILGVLMLVAIPAVTRYIEKSRRQAFISSVNSLVDSVRYGVISDDNGYSMNGKDYRVFPLKDVTTEKGSNLVKSGDLIVNKIASGYSYTLSGVISKDTKYQLKTVEADNLSENSIIDSNTNKITKLEYIQSDGTQSVNTGIKTKDYNNLSFDIKYQWISLPQSNGEKDTNAGLFGNQGSNSTVHYLRIIENQLISGERATYVTYNTALHHQTKCSFERDINTIYSERLTSTTFQSNNNVFNIKNADKRDNSDNDSSIYLFAVGAAGAKSSIKLYYFRIYDNTTLIRDFIPCKNESNVVGLCDMVNNGRFYNKTDGNAFTGKNL